MDTALHKTLRNKGCKKKAGLTPASYRWSQGISPDSSVTLTQAVDIRIFAPYMKSFLLILIIRNMEHVMTLAAFSTVFTSVYMIISYELFEYFS